MPKEQMDCDVEAVLDCKVVEGQTYYLVRWRDHRQKQHNNWLQTHEFPEILPFVQQYHLTKERQEEALSNHEESEIMQSFQKISKSLQKIRRPKLHVANSIQQAKSGRPKSQMKNTPCQPQLQASSSKEENKPTILKPISAAIPNKSRESIEDQDEVEVEVERGVRRINWLINQKKGAVEYLLEQRSGKLSIMQGRQLIALYPSQFLSYCESVMQGMRLGQ